MSLSEFDLGEFLPPDYETLPLKKRKEIVFELATPSRAAAKRVRAGLLRDGRVAATKGLRDLPLCVISGRRELDPELVQLLIAVIDRDPGVTQLALSRLTIATNPEIIPALIRALQIDNKNARWTAIHGFAAHRVKEAVPEIIRFLDDSKLRTKAGEALAYIGDERGLDPLRSASQHGSLMSRRALTRHANHLAAKIAQQRLT